MLFDTPNNLKNQNFEKMKKTTGSIIILHLHPTNDKHICGSWDIETGYELRSCIMKNYMVKLKRPPWLSLMGRQFCNFAYCRLLEMQFSAKIKVLRETPKQAHLWLKNVKANLIFLVNIPTPDPIIQHLEWNVTSICLLCWSTSLTDTQLPKKCIKIVEVYANKARKIKSVCISLHLQADKQHKSFITPVVFLNSCDLFLAVLVYMRVQQNCHHKTWHIQIEIVSNDCSRISFKDTHREEHPQIKRS